jgi:hypothetical protein
MENVDQLREDQEETLKYVIENRTMITELLESLKSGEEQKKRPNLPNPQRSISSTMPHLLMLESMLIITKF